MSTNSSTSPRQTSPPPLSSPTTTTQPTITPITTTSHSHPHSQAPSASSEAPLHIHPNLPSSPRHVTEARTAVVASLSNMVDTSLAPRASVLHENARALDKQEKDVLTATDALRKEREKLSKEADKAAKGLKEVGHVQNWAEVLERQFIVLEETVRLANGGYSRDGSEGTGSICSGCSCSDCGKDDGGSERGDGNKGVVMSDRVDQEHVVGAGHEGTSTAWSDTSPSLHEPESSTGTSTGMAKGSETASVSTSS